MLQFYQSVFLTHNSNFYILHRELNSIINGNDKFTRLFRDFTSNLRKKKTILEDHLLLTFKQHIFHHKKTKYYPPADPVTCHHIPLDCKTVFLIQSDSKINRDRSKLLAIVHQLRLHNDKTQLFLAVISKPKRIS